MAGKARTDRTLTQARETFLEKLGGGASITMACGFAKIGRTTAYEWKAADPQFAALWDDALEAGNDLLEDEARRRAVDGVERPVVAMGKIARDDQGNVLMLREYSDTLLALMLKAKKPKEYRDRLDVNANVSGNLTLNVMPDDAAL